MPFKKFAMNTTVLMGENVCEQIGPQADLLALRRIMLVTDEGLLKAGVVDRVSNHIDKKKFEVKVFAEIKPDPSVKVVDKVAAFAKDNGIDLVISVGGGSPIDAGKAIAVVANNGGSSADYEGLDKYTKPPLPLFAIPTTCGTGSEVTFGAVLTNTDTNYKFILYGYNCAPRVAFLDPNLILGIPKKVMVPTGMDALTHAVESYLSKAATPQSRPLALEAIRLISQNFVQAAQNTNDLQAISNMLYAANIAGIAFACSRLGIVHAMALPLGAFFHVPHGVANSILLPHGLEYNLGSDNSRYCDIARAMGQNTAELSDEQAAQKAIEGIKRIAVQVGAPAKLSELGVEADKIESMAKDAMKSSHIPANPRPIREEEVAELYRQAM